MSWTAATFKARWSEFAPTDDAVVQAALDEATRQINAAAFGARADDAIGLLAAHKLAVSPQGMSARLESDQGRTVYLAEYERLMRSAGGGPWAIGAWP